STDGEVGFYDGLTTLGFAKLSGSPATASFTTATLAAGPHNITAIYFPSPAFAFSASGVQPASVQSVVPAAGLFLPQGAAVDKTGDVSIADTGNNRVVEVKADGTQATVGSGLSLPSGVAVDGKGNVFIADTGNNRVVEVKPGVSQVNVGSGLRHPEGLAV